MKKYLAFALLCFCALLFTSTSVSFLLDFDLGETAVSAIFAATFVFFAIRFFEKKINRKKVKTVSVKKACDVCGQVVSDPIIKVPMEAAANACHCDPSTSFGKKLAAPTISTAILSHSYDDVNLFIVKGQEPDFALIKVGDVVELEQESENNYDPNAVYAISGGQKLGYIYRGKLQDMINDRMNRSESIIARVESVDAEKGKIQLMLGFKKHSAVARPAGNIFRLAGNAGAEMQENISDCSDGEEVDVEYDDEKDRYAAFCGSLPIGFLPKSAHPLFEEGDDCEACIDRIVENGQGKYEIYVEVNV